MSDIPPTRRTDEPPTRDGAPLAGWPTTITSEQAASLQTALKQLQIALDAVVRERDEARAEVEHWRQARNDALAAGDILKAEVERLRCISRDLLDTLSAAVRSGDFSLSGTEDMAEFVRQALRNLEEIAR